MIYIIPSIDRLDYGFTIDFEMRAGTAMLGHYSAGFTLDTYTHVTSKMQQQAAEKMGGFMAGVEGMGR